MNDISQIFPSSPPVSPSDSEFSFVSSSSTLRTPGPPPRSNVMSKPNVVSPFVTVMQELEPTVKRYEMRERKPKAEVHDTSQCWLCTYATDTAAHTVNALICEHIHCMSLDTISSQCSMVIQQEIQKRNPCNREEVQGYSPGDVRRHIMRHMLHPNVTLGLTLRHLVDLNENIRNSVLVDDDESDSKVLDQSNLKNYLAVTAQITSIYKLGETGKLLFSRGSAAESMGSSSGGTSRAR